MNEKINIIKAETSLVVQNLTEEKEFKPSKSSFCISRNKLKQVIISSLGNFAYITAFSNVTIQDGKAGTPVQLTPENWSSLTEGLNDSKGGGAGDMKKSVYDTNDNGIVDDSEKLGGKLPSEFATSEQGGKADSAIQGVKVNGTDLTPDASNVVDIPVPTNYVRKSGDTMTGALKLPSPTADNDASNKKYVDDKISALESNALTFKGFISTTEPTIDVREGNLWYQPASALDTPDTNFPWQVKTYTSGAWSSTTTSYTPDAGDRWANVDDNSSGWYYEGQVWHKLDFGGSTFDSDEFDTSGGVVSLKPSGVQAITDPKVINLTNHAATVNYEIRPFVPYAFVDDTRLNASVAISVTDAVNTKSTSLRKLVNADQTIIQIDILANQLYMAYWDGSRWMILNDVTRPVATLISNTTNSIPTTSVVYNLQQALQAEIADKDIKVINLTNHVATVAYEIKPYTNYAFIDNANIGYGLSISITDSTNIKSSLLNQIYAGSVGSIQATIPANTAYIAFWDGARWMLNTNNGFGLASSVTNDPNSVPSSRVLYNALQAKANATIVKEATIAVADWQGSAAPYSVTISDTDVTDSRLILVNPVTASYNDYKEADIYPETASSTDSFTLYANEEKPVNPITIQYSILS